LFTRTTAKSLDCEVDLTVTTSSNKLIAELNDVRIRAVDLVRGLSREELTGRPDPANWSIAECLEHLNKTAAVIQPKIAAAIEHGKKDKIFGKGPASPGPIGRFLIWMAEPPPKFKLPAPKEIVPRPDQGDPAEIVAEFTKVQEAWERLIRESEGLDQNKIKISAPFPGLPRLRLAAPIPWMMAHQRRHLLQAEGVKVQLQTKAERAAR
jgi:hypothetical protein